MRDSMRLFFTLLQDDQINGTISHTWIIQSSIVLMKLLPSQSKKELCRFPYNLHEKCAPAIHSSVIFPGSLLAKFWCKFPVLPYKRLMRMCRWMGLHFHDWIDYNGVAFSIGLEWVAHFRIFEVWKTLLLMCIFHPSASEENDLVRL